MDPLLPPPTSLASHSNEQAHKPTNAKVHKHAHGTALSVPEQLVSLMDPRRRTLVPASFHGIYTTSHLSRDRSTLIL